MPERVDRLNAFFETYRSGDEYDRAAIAHSLRLRSGSDLQGPKQTSFLALRYAPQNCRQGSALFYRERRSRFLGHEPRRSVPPVKLVTLAGYCSWPTTWNRPRRATGRYIAGFEVSVMGARYTSSFEGTIAESAGSSSKSVRCYTQRVVAQLWGFSHEHG
jgi:hypothetical protein